jgi:hypothetical protein
MCGLVPILWSSMRPWAMIFLTACSPEMRHVPLQTKDKAAICGMAMEGFANKENVQGSSIH